MLSDPKVSVLMAVYNGEKYLRQAVNSVLTQTFTDFEFVLIDDGSTDSSPQILRDYAQADARIRLVSRPNKGLTKTLNEGLHLARAPYIARMDSDDICLPERFARQVEFLDAHPKVLLVGAQVELIDPDGDPISLKHGIENTAEEIDEALLNKGWPLVHPAVMMRRDAVLAIGGYCEKYITNQDHDLFLRLSETGPLANLPEPLLQYRQHFESISLARSKQQGDTVEEIVREAYLRRNLDIEAAMLRSRPKPLTATDYHRTWCWEALSAGNIATARKHATAIFKKRPFSFESWKLMYCSLRGH